MFKLLLCIFYVFFTVSGLVLVKYGTMAKDAHGIVIPFVNHFLSYWFIIGMLFYVISFVLYIGVISHFNLGWILPIMGGVVNVLILICAIGFLGEQLGTNSIIGALIIIIGIVIMSL